MKIIGSDNFARETVADSLLLHHFPNTEEHKKKAEEFCEWLNSFSCDSYGGVFYRVVDDDYRLSRGMEDLV